MPLPDISRPLNVNAPDFTLQAVPQGRAFFIFFFNFVVLKLEIKLNYFIIRIARGSLGLKIPHFNGENLEKTDVRKDCLAVHCSGYLLKKLNDHLQGVKDHFEVISHVRIH